MYCLPRFKCGLSRTPFPTRTALFQRRWPIAFGKKCRTSRPKCRRASTQTFSPDRQESLMCSQPQGFHKKQLDDLTTLRNITQLTHRHLLVLRTYPHDQQLPTTPNGMTNLPTTPHRPAWRSRNRRDQPAKNEVDHRIKSGSIF